MTDRFTHLHAHSDYSFLDGVPSVSALAQGAKERGMECLALTDHGKMHGLFGFDTACRKLGVHPLVGAEAYLTEGPTKRDATKESPCVNDNFHITFLIKNLTGFRNLNTLMAMANRDNFYYYPRVTRTWLEEYHEGLVVLSGCISSLVNQSIIAAAMESEMTAKQRTKTGIREGEFEKAEETFRWFKEVFGDDFYAEIMDHGLEAERICARTLRAWARQYDVKLVGTNDIHYVNEDDVKLQGIITNMTKKGDGDSVGHAGLWMRTYDEMLARPTFAEMPEALDNTRLVADKCAAFTLPRPNLDVQSPADNILLPKFPLPPGTDAPTWLWGQIVEGCKRRYGRFDGEVEARARYEYGVIKNMGFCDYFLVVSDFMRWAKAQKIRCGPARGSAGGSLVAYVLDIIDLDPLAFGLLFERFLNPERISMPDIDLDFEDARRHEVVAYTVQKYGHDHVAGIATFGTMAGRSAIKDTCRSMDVGYAEAEKLASFFSTRPGSKITDPLGTPAFEAFLASEPSLREVVDTAVAIAGRNRHASQHAAGIVISGPPLNDYIPTMTIKEQNVTQIGMKEAEELGFLKMDFLGIKTLTVISNAEKLIEEQTGVPFHVGDHPLDDPAVYAMLRRGDLFGLFQLEGKTATPCTMQIKPTEFSDIVAINALGRPGPMDLVPAFAARKAGTEAPTPPHPCLEEVLASTYGIIVYQEQAMKVAVVFAGYTNAQADSLRKGIGKKDPVLIASHRTSFIEGGIAQGHTREEGEMLFDLIEKFKDYAFNLSHATGYGMIGYWTAVLACHHPGPFFAALLTSETGNRDRTAAVVAEMLRRNIPLLPPDVNRSQPHTSFEDLDGQSAVRLGLAMVKGISAELGRKIRAKAPYDSLDALFLATKATTAALESLVRAGACDAFLPEPLPSRRSMLLEAIPFVTRRGRKYAGETEKAKMQGTLFGIEEHFVPYPLIEVNGQSLRTVLENEMEAVGFYLSMSPLTELTKKEPNVSALSVVPEEPDEEDDERPHFPNLHFLVELRDMKVIYTKTKNEPMLLAEVADAQGTKRKLTIFPQLYAKIAPSAPTIGTILRLKAHGNLYNGRIGLLGEDATVVPLKDLQALMDREEAFDKEVLHVSFTPKMHKDPIWLTFVTDTLNDPSHSGDKGVYFHYFDGAKILQSVGVSSPHRTAQALAPLFGGRVCAGNPELCWSDELKSFEMFDDIWMQENRKDDAA